MRKLSYDEVYQIFKDNGYELLDKEYVNSSTKMTCIDNEKYKYFIKLDALRDGVKYSRFCNNNPYTDYNIDNLLKIRDGIYKRITSNITSTRQDIDLVDIDGYKYRIKVASLISKETKLTAVGNDNYWSIFNMSKYLNNIKSTDTLLTTEFIKQSESLDWMCKNGHIFHTNWNNYHSKGFRCMECARNSKMYTFDECKEMVSKRDGYELLSIKRIKNIQKTDVLYYFIRHECGHEYWVCKQDFDIGKSCKPCTDKRIGINKRVGIEEIKRKVENVDGYKLIDTKYENGECRIKVLHETCGRIKWKSFSNWISGNRCLNCSNSEATKLPKEEWINRVEVISSYNFKLLSVVYKSRKDQKGNEAHLEIKCMDCGKIFTRAGNGWRNGCPCCAKSKGEKEIRRILECNKIDFTSQKKYKGLVGVGGRKLSYDFYIPSYNSLIEYQGEFHDGTDRMPDKSYLDTQKEHDRRKREYAEKNNINLLEIWYWDYKNIEEILKGYILNNEKGNSEWINHIL